MKLEGKLELLVYSDSVASNNPQHRMMDVKENISSSTVVTWQTLRLTVANLTVDQAINLNAASASQLYLKSDQSISIKINGSLTALTGQMFYMSANITSLTISNSSGAVATIECGLGA